MVQQEFGAVSGRRLDIMEDFAITRRTAFVAGALGAVAAVTLGKTAIAAEEKKSDTKTNEKIVNDFIGAWNDPNKAVTFLADNCAVRMEEDKPAITGPANVAAAFKGFMGHGEKVDVKILNTYAEGPLVTNKRADTLTTLGKPPQRFPMVGVFIVKKGKIIEWTDYLDV
jgi:limonene-1,2-epoxide hydrolase